MATAGTDTSVVVIGAGQAGLSVAFYLRRLGLDPGNDFVLLDRGPGTGGAWQFRWEALRLGSAHHVNDLPGMDELGLSFETADRTIPAKDVVADYYRQYEEHYDLQVVRPANVTSVLNNGANLLVTFDTSPPGDGAPDDDESNVEELSGRAARKARKAQEAREAAGEDTEKNPNIRQVSTDIVVNATGTWGAPFVPWYAGRNSFKGRQVHTNDYVQASEFAGQNVIVVGGGTSAVGFLLELEESAASLTWVSRRDVDFLEGTELNMEAGTAAVAMQDEAARAGRALPSIVSGTGIPRTRKIQAGIDRGLLTPKQMFSSIEPNGVRWSNGYFQPADAIVWATGFRPELRHLAPLKLREKEGGVVVAAGSSWKDPRVFFAGYGPQASTIGANRAGRLIARQVVASLSKL